jgi:hypothetical protein
LTIKTEYSLALTNGLIALENPVSGICNFMGQELNDLIYMVNSYNFARFLH